MPEKETLKFQPIAIVGRGCVLPGCHSVDDLWKIVESGEVTTSSASGDDWHVDQQRLTSDEPGVFVPDRMWSTQGGYVRDFLDHFDATQFNLDAKLLEQLDPVFLWSLEAARQAMSEFASTENLKRAGVVLGNLSYPTKAHSRFAEEIWLNEMRGESNVSHTDVAPENRFMSGLPAMLVAKGLGLGGNTMALDAACASGLYAIKVACDRLQDGRADLMLAGGINAADPLFIHMGFCALNALSKTGSSQPFSENADGLVPSEGAAFVALKRLADARADGDHIYGVVRGVGLSNDGRSGGFLSPSTDGQVTCIKRAYEMAEVDPVEVQFVECHATGTDAGDSAELKSLSEVFPDANKLPLGSLKGNLGHLITASGVAGLIKILLAFENKTIPGTPNSAPNLPAVAGNGFEVPTANSEWKSDGARLAAISSFGFGGNNAHLLVSEESSTLEAGIEPKTETEIEKFAIVNLAVRTSDDPNADAFGRRICGAGANVFDGNDKISLAAKSLAFPPNDLKEALGQQLLLIELLPQLQASIESTDSERMGIFIGMQTDSEVCRAGLRWRLQDLDPGGDEVDLNAEIAPIVNAASVIGRMPNVPANRISNQLDITGPGFTVSREELSGDAALDLAMTAIKRGELDAAVVGAVEVTDKQIDVVALQKVSPSMQPEDSHAAVMMVIKTESQARKDGDQILALIEAAQIDAAQEQSDTTSSVHPETNITAHAAEGLLNLAAGVQRMRAGQMTGVDSGTGILRGTALIQNRSIFGESTSWLLHPAPEGVEAFAVIDRPEIEMYAANNRNALVTNIKNGKTGGSGSCRAALVGRHEDFLRLRERAIKSIPANTKMKSWSLDGISFSEGPMEGEIAAVFTGAASAYPGMGKDLFLGLPGISGELATEIPESAVAMSVAFDAEDDRHRLPSLQLAGSSYLCQLHAKISKDLLGLKPVAALGLSSGETNSMFAFGVWQDMDSLLRDIDNSELYNSALAADFSAVRSSWNLGEDEVVDWDNYRVLAPVDEVQKAIEEEEHAYLTIIQSDKDSVIGGSRAACEAVLKRLGNPERIALGHDLAVHCSVVEPFGDQWRDLHTRKTKAPKDIRFYSSYQDGAYKITRKSVADALTGQALQTIDFRRIIEAAWNDGVRIFVEHGPRNSLTSAIDEILGDRPHLAVALDHPAVSSMTQLYRAAATLWCSGVDVDLSGLQNVEPEMEEPPGIQFNVALPAIRAQMSMQSDQAANSSGSEVYRPPATSVGELDARLLEPAPALARTIKASSAAVVSVDVNRQTPTVSKMKAPLSKVPQKEPKKEPKNSPKKMPAVNQPLAVQSDASSRISNITPGDAAQPLISQQVAIGEHQLVVEAHQRMLQAHQSFLSAQMEGQRAYEETMGRMQTALMGGASGPVISTPVSEMPPTITPIASVAKKNSSEAPANEPQPVAPPENTVVNEVQPAARAREPITLPGPSFTREQLEVLAGGKISSVLGPIFEQQDQYDVQVRMPEPPLLLCDRVLGIEGEAGSMGTGTIWTETDVHHDSWYLHHGRMPPGIFIESGQADLLLISWLGIDFHNKGDRAYRLLGCELVFHGELPQPGDTLEYEIKVDGHAQQGDVRLFFFHYDCHINGQLRISVRSGQAGFFTKEELADSAGVLWDAETADYTPGIDSVSPVAVCHKSSFTREDVAAYLKGDLQACFGDEFIREHTHTLTPRSPDGQGNFLGEVTHFEPEGGPSGRGYLRIVEDIHTDDWFFDGHFKNDPCMPGTLMADACLQAMAFYMSARGHTLHRDGWRFQPVRETNYKFVCRGQALPESGQLVYEIFIDEEIVDSEPRIYAHVLCTIDGRKAFLCERLGLQLVPDWPLSSMPELLEPIADDRPLAKIDDFPLDYRSLISCAWGKPSTAFGEGFSHYDGPLRSPRLPGPPYHFMTRIVALEGEMASMKKGGYVEALYDIPEDEWYFGDNGSRTMPFCVLMEIALQPCGWLASYTLGKDYADSDLLFRNLDGTGTQHREIVSGDGTLKTSATLTSISQIGELIIENFDVECTIGDEIVYTMKTVFGFFPPDAMANQKGLKITDHEREIFDRPSNSEIDLRSCPAPYFDHPTAHLPDSKLLMVDRITFLDPDGGEASVGSIRGEKDVDITEWFFKAHFFQDPVQPGSLGIEAMLQVMQTLMLSQGLHVGFVKPRFEPIMIEGETEWHYRGQITPDKTLITIDFECVERHVEEGNCWISGEARLWGDGLKIYHAPRIGMRIVEDDAGLASFVNKDSGKNKVSTKKELIDQSAVSTGESIAPDWRSIRDYWIERSAGEHFLVHDIGASLIHKFVHGLVHTNSGEFNARKGQPAIYLANHQVGVESFLFLGMIAALTGIPAEAVAKKEHKESWLGQISQLTEAELKEDSTTRMLFFDRDDQSDMLRILNNFGETIVDQPRSLLVHVDGTRATQAGQPTEKISSVLIDLSIKYGIPIIPVRFTGGLPLKATSERLEFPVDFGQQDYNIGDVIGPDDLEVLPYVERAKLVVAAINGLGGSESLDKPLPSDDVFKSLVDDQPQGRNEIQRVLWAALQSMPELGDRMQRLLKIIASNGNDKLTPSEKIVAKLLG
jgi:acyl transferase domain-containing protein/3-hydroxymyristoyl/3-hydroxydecanoyl-(acyl carrier protein) dehydratase